jgi:hypothetical protein
LVEQKDFRKIFQVKIKFEFFEKFWQNVKIVNCQENVKEGTRVQISRSLLGNRLFLIRKKVASVK